MKASHLVIKILKLLVFIPIFLYHPVYTKDNPALFSFSQEEKSQYLGDWFSDFHKTRLGVSVYQIRLEKHEKFDLYKLSLHPDMKWEEARYRGDWKFSAGVLDLKARHCSVYTSTEPGKRRALLRAFDCDHLSMKIAPKESNHLRINLSPNQYGQGHSTEFHRPMGRKQGKWAVVLTNGKKNIAWGIDLKYHKKGQNAVLYSASPPETLGANSQVVLEKVVETSLEFRSLGSSSAKTGDYLFLSR